MDKVHHIAVQVSNIQDSIKWYKKEFICEIEYEDDSWAMIKFDNVKLALVIPSQHPNHFAIQSENPGKYGELTKHRDNTESIYIKDPAGNYVEIIKIN